jgi:hypothetical protein
MKALLRISLVALVLALFLPFAAQQLEAQGKHPHYLRALSDLRTARALLQRPNGGALHAEEKAAIHKIDDAIGEIKKASIDDGKNIEDHEPVDAHLPWRGRLHKSRDLLDKAYGDCSKEEDDPYTRGLQARVLVHIKEAHHHVDEAIAIVESR